MDIEWQDALLRLGAATGAGMAIGINRDLTNKPIGMRTLALVSLGAAAVTVAAIRCSSSLAGMTHATRDRSELTQPRLVGQECLAGAFLESVLSPSWPQMQCLRRGSGPRLAGYVRSCCTVPATSSGG